MNDNDVFWEHLTDHLIIAVSFFSLGMIVCIYFIMTLLKKRVVIDYDLALGTIMRVRDKKGKRWLVVSKPSNLVQSLDVILLSLFDRGKDKIISELNRKRLRVITVIFLIFLSVVVLSGVLLILSAAEKSMNPFDYIF